MSFISDFLSDRKQDVQAAVAGFVIGEEAAKQGIEDDIDWSTIEDIVGEEGIDFTEGRRSIVDKAISVGYIAKSIHRASRE